MLTRFRSKNSKSVGQKGGWNRSSGFLFSGKEKPDRAMRPGLYILLPR